MATNIEPSLQPVRTASIPSRMSIHSLDGNYEVVHHTVFIDSLLAEKKLKAARGL